MSTDAFSTSIPWSTIMRAAGRNPRARLGQFIDGLERHRQSGLCPKEECVRLQVLQNRLQEALTEYTNATVKSPPLGTP